MHQKLCVPAIGLVLSVSWCSLQGCFCLSKHWSSFPVFLPQ
jgi:hypothetical protein